MVLVAFDEVWQYGSKRVRGRTYGNSGDNTDDPIEQQNGVASQCAMFGIGTQRDQEDEVGRSFFRNQKELDDIPEIKFKKNFFNSHWKHSYKWIFTKQEGQDGYVDDKK